MQDAATTIQAGLWERDAAGRALYRLSLLLALLGGAVLLAMIGVSVWSVVGRWLADSPVQGDFELVQLGCAVCVATFLPLCQLEKGHVIVDFFTLKASAGVRAWLDAIGSVLLGLCSALVAWRLTLGLESVRSAGETSMILDLPIWYGYAPMVVSFAVLALAGFYVAWAELAYRSAE